MQNHPDEAPLKISADLYELLFAKDRGGIGRPQPTGTDGADTPVPSQPPVPVLSREMLEEYGDTLEVVPGLESLIVEIGRRREELEQLLEAIDQMQQEKVQVLEETVQALKETVQFLERIIRAQEETERRLRERVQLLEAQVQALEGAEKLRDSPQRGFEGCRPADDVFLQENDRLGREDKRLRPELLELRPEPAAGDRTIKGPAGELNARTSAMD
jgi:hypothetical protein